jgi:hypothetical protein
LKRSSNRNRIKKRAIEKNSPRSIEEPTFTPKIIENTDNIPSSGGKDTFEEMMKLAEEIQHNADQLSELSSKLRNEAERWAERSWRALSKD